MTRTVTITGGSGFLGQLLRAGLREQGWDVRVFDPVRGPVVDLVRRRYLAGSARPRALPAARAVRRLQVRAEPVLARAGAIRRGSDDILAEPDLIAARLAGSDAVIHLAGIPHPFQAGATDADFVRLNYDGALNVFAAARAAGVGTFVFASSAQVYRINDPVRMDVLPIPETAYLPLPSEGQTTYGFLKAAVERWLAGACTTGDTRAVALRLEYPGFRSTTAENLYVSTSIENVVAGVAAALTPRQERAFGVYNLADAVVDPAIVDVQRYVRARWPYAENRVVGNGGLLDVELARRELGYRPTVGGRYVDASLVW